MKLLDYALPLSAALLLLAFFWGLPDLKSCRLPAPDGRTGSPLPDLLIAGGLTLAYALTAFAGLGGRVDPQSFEPMAGQSAVIALGEDTPPAKLLLYCGVGQGGYELEFSDDGESWRPGLSFEQDHVAVLKWHELEIPAAQAQAGLSCVRVRCAYGSPWLGEVALLDASGAVLPAAAELPALCDEPDTVPARQELENSTYFDEIYHARTAWEHLHGLWPYEISHPPLGKEILSLGILLFGMNPFGWRFMGTLFGALMLPVMYVFLKKLFGGRWVPALGTLVFASDFMHFTQTRIATIDTYGVFFILLMYLFFYCWLSDGSRWALALSGLSFGLGAASKWTAVYAGAGLGLLWLLHWLRLFWLSRRGRGPSAPLGFSLGEKLSAKRTDEGNPSASPAALSGTSAGRGKSRRPACSSPSGRGSPGAHTGEVRGAPEIPRSSSGAAERKPAPAPLFPAFVRNALFCLLFFVALPALIYYLSYLPYGRAQLLAPFTREYTDMVLDNQVFMFTYHAGIVAEHPYSSRWYQWMLDIRPILYYLDTLPDGSRRSIAAFLNPALCWGGLLSLFVLAYTALFRRDRKAVFLLLGYLAQLLPWVFIRRLTFAYHYFPSSVFLVLSLGYVFALLRDGRRRWLCWALPFALSSLGLFALFYPVLSGAPVDPAFADRFLQWLPTWPL